MLTRAVQLEKAYSSIKINVDGNVIVSIDLHPANAFAPIFNNPLGKTTFDKY